MHVASLCALKSASCEYIFVHFQLKTKSLNEFLKYILKYLKICISLHGKPINRKLMLKKTVRKIILNSVYVISVLIVGIVLFRVFSYSRSNDIDDAAYKTQRTNYAMYTMAIPKKVYFAQERVPVENFDVRESLDKELHKVSFWHSEMFLYLKRANRYFPYIEAVLKKNGVPEDFKYLCVTESGLTNVVSPAGAAGFWQFMPATAREYGLIVSKEVDERYNWKKATFAACKYLKRRYKKYGSWALVAASYNAGDGGVNKFMDYQKENSYYDLALYEETARYVYRAIAIKLVMENPRRYGFNYRKRDLYPVLSTKQIKIDSTISNMATFAKSQGMPYKVFKMLNPWLRKHQLSNESRRTYSITVLKKGARSRNYFPDKKKKGSKKNKINVPKKDNFEKSW